MEHKVALVAGAQGVIGRTLVGHLAGLPDWQVIGLSRRKAEAADGVRHVAVDLLDAGAVAGALSRLPPVTHVFYAAYQDRPGWGELVAPNLAMLVNLVEAAEAASPRLRHVSLMHRSTAARPSGPPRSGARGSTGSAPRRSPA